jgi:uncharacterized membrane protein (UPF0182 family)
MDVTLTQALVQIFGRGIANALAPDQLASSATSVVETTAVPAPAVVGVTPARPSLSALAAEAKQHYENAEKAQRAGDWAAYGEEMKQLQRVLEKMQTMP